MRGGDIMKMQADLHVHTTASGHGYSTIKEIVDEAGPKGLKLIAITDHGLKMPGAPHWYHFTNMISLPRVINGVELLRGVEANILDCQGNIDMPDEIIHNYLDIVLAGFHDSTGYTGTTLEENTEAMIAAIKNPDVHIITHPGNPKYPVDVEKVVMAAKEYNKVIELNNQSFVCRPNSFPNCNKFARMARKHDILVAINSDAHICYNVGNHEVALAMAQKAGIRKSQIINTSPEKVWEYLNWHKQKSELKKAQ
jgi:Histidinol phosphatase and related hydrolases of the PHP family